MYSASIPRHPATQHFLNYGQGTKNNQEIYCHKNKDKKKNDKMNKRNQIYIIQQYLAIGEEFYKCLKKVQN